MAVRSDCSASSGLTSNAGGVRRPARCRAASTSTISERRESSELRICCSRESSGRSRASALADSGLDAAHLGCDVDQLLIELAAVLTDRRDIGLELLLQFRCALCCARVASSSCSRCLMMSGEAVDVCGVEAATCAAAGKGTIPAKPADNKAMQSGLRTEDRGPRLMVSGYEWMFRVDCIESESVLSGASARG